MEYKGDNANELTSFSPFPSPFPSFLSGVLLWRLECVGLTTKQPRLTYFQDRGHWSSGHRGAPSILPGTRR